MSHSSRPTKGAGASLLTWNSKLCSICIGGNRIDVARQGRRFVYDLCSHLWLGVPERVWVCLHEISAGPPEIFGSRLRDKHLLREVHAWASAQGDGSAMWVRPFVSASLEPCLYRRAAAVPHHPCLSVSPQVSPQSQFSSVSRPMQVCVLRRLMLPSMPLACLVCLAARLCPCFHLFRMTLSFVSFAWPRGMNVATPRWALGCV